MSEKIVQFNEEIIKGKIKELVRGKGKETQTSYWGRLTQATRYERSEERQGYPAITAEILPRPPAM